MKTYTAVATTKNGKAYRIAVDALNATLAQRKIKQRADQLLGKQIYTIK